VEDKMRKILLGLLAISAAVPAVSTAAVAQDWGRDRYERDYRDGGSDRGDRYVQYDHRDSRYDRDHRGYYGEGVSGGGRYATYYDGRGYYHGPTWRGNDGRYYCRRSDGTTGLIVGGITGSLVGRTIDTHGDRAPGTLLGGAIGALLGQAIDRDGARCR
jgi:hypothetical protein